MNLVMYFLLVYIDNRIWKCFLMRYDKKNNKYFFFFKTVFITNI